MIDGIDGADVKVKQQQLRRQSIIGEPRKSANNDNNRAATKGRRSDLLSVPRGSHHGGDGLRRRDPLVSDVPLPPGVKCIDPQNDLLFAHWPEFIKYAKYVVQEMRPSTAWLGQCIPGYFSCEIAPGRERASSSTPLEL